MNQTKLVRRLALPVRDFAAGLSLFLLVAASSAGVAPTSGAGWIATSAQAHFVKVDNMDGMIGAILAVPAVAGPNGLMATLCLALAFASLFALNLWFARHVKRVHATYRRRR